MIGGWWGKFLRYYLDSLWRNSDKIVEIKAILSDGSAAVFADLSPAEFMAKKRNTLESSIYKNIFEELSNKETQNEITKEFPKPEIHRRNTGYAVDILLKSELFDGTEPTINLGKLLCGSEGTLAFTTEVTLKVDALPLKTSWWWLIFIVFRKV
jgi:FAD/FMN-containing dehydrogenase